MRGARDDAEPSARLKPEVFSHRFREASRFSFQCIKTQSVGLPESVGELGFDRRKPHEPSFLDLP
jgi:hypothetical protein